MSLQEILTGGGGVLFLLSVIVQISPVKVNPWSWIAKQIGRAINGEVIEKVEGIEKEVRSLKDKQAEAEGRHDKRDADLCRTRILRFADELRRDIQHSEEFFDQALDDINTYETYCRNHKDYENNKAVAAIEKIKRTYKERLDKNDFL